MTDKKSAANEGLSEKVEPIPKGAFNVAYGDDNYVIIKAPTDDSVDGYIQREMGGLCSRSEVSQVPIITKTPNGIEVLNRINMAYIHKGREDDPQAGYDFAYHLWFHCLQRELIKISKEKEIITLCFLSRANLESRDKIDYRITLDCDNIQEAESIIDQLPWDIELRMEEIIPPI